jgi:hypothetical protein
VDGVQLVKLTERRIVDIAQDGFTSAPKNVSLNEIDRFRS